MKTTILLLILAVSAAQATLYRVQVRTEFQPDAGTNGAINFQLVGKKGVSSSTHRLDNGALFLIDLYNDFEPGLLTTYNIVDNDNIGALKCVRFSTTSHDAWLPSYAVVTPEGGRDYHFYNTEGSWVSAEESDGGSSSLQMCEQGTETYYITTHTSPELDAGSNSLHLLMKIKGQKGSTETGFLDNSERNDFESGAADTFTLRGMRFVGKVKCVELEVRGEDAWLVDYIEVNCARYRSAYTFHNDGDVKMSANENEGSRTLRLC